MLRNVLISSLLFISATKPFALIHGHSHNDYSQKIPLTTALDCQFCSIEADVNLVDGDLLVAHDRKHTVKGKTLESMYLEPLRKRIEENHGRVYPEVPTIVLLIDVKSDPVTTYHAIRDRLAKYQSIFTHWENGQKIPGAMTAMITGFSYSKISAEMESEKTRYAAFDGHLDDMYAKNPPSADFVPQIAIQWGKLFQWDGFNRMPDAERKKLSDLVTLAHAQHRTLRLWDAPDNSRVWREERDAHVDWINTDRLKDFREWSTKNDSDRQLPESIR